MAAVDTPSGQPVEVLPTDWREQVRALAEERDAVILAHNYQLPEIQDIAHHVGDSLGLSRLAARAEQSTIVFCGVHFMAETAKILSYDKTVLIPDERAGCSLAETITADQVRAWKQEYAVAGEPDPVVVMYVNTTAAVKAETDICCTSSNAVDVVASIPDDRTVLFGPDQFLAPTCSGPSSATTCTSGWGNATCTRASTEPTSRSRSRPTRAPSCSSTPSAVAPRARSTSPSPVSCRRTARTSCRPGAWSTGPAGPAPSGCSSPPRPACCTRSRRRLASNSVTEGVVAGTRLGTALAAELPTAVEVGADSGRSFDAPLRNPAQRVEMRSVMSSQVGVLRTPWGMEGAIRQLEALASTASVGVTGSRASWEATNMLTVAAAVATSALARTESRGCHRREDHPEPRAAWLTHLDVCLTIDGGLAVTGIPHV